MFDPKSTPPTNMKMLKMFLYIAIPAMTTNMIAFFVNVSNDIFAGRLNEPTKLATVGLTSTVMNVFVTVVLLGLNSAQETLTS